MAATTPGLDQTKMLDIYRFYEQMEQHNIMLSFKGDITSELLTSILQIMETKMEDFQEEPKVKKKVYNVLVECLQNLYHHNDEDSLKVDGKKKGSAMFMIGKKENNYTIITGNYLPAKSVPSLKNRLDQINAMSKEELKDLYKEILNNDEFSAKGGGGLGMIDIARKTGQKLNYAFLPVDDQFSFFSLNVNISQ